MGPNPRLQNNIFSLAKTYGAHLTHVTLLSQNALQIAQECPIAPKIVTTTYTTSVSI